MPTAGSHAADEGEDAEHAGAEEIERALDELGPEVGGERDGQHGHEQQDRLRIEHVHPPDAAGVRLAGGLVRHVGDDDVEGVASDPHEGAQHAERDRQGERDARVEIGGDGQRRGQRPASAGRRAGSRRPTSSPGRSAGWSRP